MRLELQGLTVRYGPIEAVRSVDLVVEPGSVTALIGANGAGKSTLLNAVMGLVRASAGRILLDDLDMTNRPAEARVTNGVALSPEGRRLFPDLTVEENLLTGAYSRRDGGRAADLARIFELFPSLARRRRQPGRNLSGGEQQMVAIGRALMSRPRLLLLDEPSLGLAPIVVDGLGEAIGDVNRQGVAVLLVEQDARWALSIARTGHIMSGGRITATAPASELLDDCEIQKAFLGAGSSEPTTGQARTPA